MQVVLTLGNHMNEGQHRGFTLDSLLKLHEAKAFDRKTSILHYLIQVRPESLADESDVDRRTHSFFSCPPQVIKKNDDSILTVSQGLKSVVPASKKTFEVVNTELKELEVGFDLVQRMAADIPKPDEAMVRPQCRNRPWQGLALKLKRRDVSCVTGVADDRVPPSHVSNRTSSSRRGRGGDPLLTKV